MKKIFFNIPIALFAILIISKVQPAFALVASICTWFLIYFFYKFCLLIYQFYKACILKVKSKLELIFNTVGNVDYADETTWGEHPIKPTSCDISQHSTAFQNSYKINKNERILCKNPFSLENKLKSLPNKNGAIQLKKLATMTQSFEEIIFFKIDEDKESIVEYRHAVNQVYQAVQDNLQHYYGVMKSVEPINSKIMYEAAIYSADEKKDLAQEWSTLFSKQKKRARDVLVQNEQAITQLYIFITDIVNKKPDNSMNKALDKLTQLTKATKQYSDEFLPSPYL